MLLSVIIPNYNEEATIITVLEAVAAQRLPDVDLEVIVVDDGSTDRSVELLRKRPDLYTHLLCLEKNGGKGAAVKAGLRRASGDYIVFQDADLEYNPASFKALVFPVVEFGAQVVMGSRMMAPPYTRVFYFWHKVGNRLITLFFNVLNNTTFTDVYSCYLMYQRDLMHADELRTEGWEQHGEILSKVVGRAKVIYEVPVTYQGRSYDEGKKIRAHHALAVLLTMARERLFPARPRDEVSLLGGRTEHRSHSDA